MIAKHVSMKSVRKSNFAEVVKYITDEQDKSERVGNVTVTKCQSDRPDQAAIEIWNTQAKILWAILRFWHLKISRR